LARILESDKAGILGSLFCESKLEIVVALGFSSIEVAFFSTSTFEILLDASVLETLSVFD
jgi:hypothetical protein